MSDKSTTEAKATPTKRVNAKEIDLRPFTHEDLEQLPTLMRDCLGRRVTRSWLEWRFFGSPYPEKLGFVVGYYGDDLVAFIGANPVPFAINGELSLVYQHQDTAIREDCRGFRLLRSMAEACEALDSADNGQLTYSITAPHMRTLVTKRMKYTIVWENLKMVKLISLRGMVSKVTRSAALTAILPGPIGRSWKAPGSMTGDIEELDTFGPDMDEFWNDAKAPADKLGCVFPWQDAAWLNYKFSGDEMVTFSKFVYRESGKIVGYIILNTTKLDVKIGYIDSLWSLPGRQDVIELLRDWAIYQFIKAKCDQVTCWTRTDAPVGEALGKIGFVRRPTAQCISVKQLAEGMGDLGLKGEHWNLQRGHTYYTALGHLDIDEGQQRLAHAKQARDEERSERLRQ